MRVDVRFIEIATYRHKKVRLLRMEKHSLNRPFDLAEWRLGMSLGELMYPD
jgi:hypothetical protein